MYQNNAYLCTGNNDKPLLVKFVKYPEFIEIQGIFSLCGAIVAQNEKTKTPTI
jgi:hypothetical protein